MAKAIFTAGWYPWYVDAVLESESVDHLSLAEEGAYRRALDREWKKGSVPADPKAMAIFIGKKCTEKIAARVLELFVPMPKTPGRMINLTLEKIRKEQERKFRKKSEAGTKGMLNRWKQKGNNHNTVITLDNSIEIENKSIKEEEKNPLPPTNSQSRTEGEFSEKRRVQPSPIKPAAEIMIWLDAVAVACGAKNRQTLTVKNRWAAVCEAAIREERSLSDMLTAVKAERERVGEDIQFFTPEGVLRKLQMLPIGRNGNGSNLPKLADKLAADKAARQAAIPNLENRA